MTLEQLIYEIRLLPTDQRKQLVHMIVDTLADETPIRDRSILEFEGIVQWDGTDAQEYVNQLRSEWDDRL